jgi:hypothetical protein
MNVTSADHLAQAPTVGTSKTMSCVYKIKAAATERLVEHFRAGPRLGDSRTILV